VTVGAFLAHQFMVVLASWPPFEGYAPSVNQIGFRLAEQIVSITKTTVGLVAVGHGDHLLAVLKNGINRTGSSSDAVKA